MAPNNTKAAEPENGQATTTPLPKNKRTPRKAPAPADKPKTSTPRKPKPKRDTPSFQKQVQAEVARDKEEATKRPVGRPSEFTEERFQTILERIACGESVRSICSDESMPCRQTFFIWLYRMPELVDRYTRAKEISTLSDEDALIEIADDGTNDWVEKLNKDGDVVGYLVNGEVVARSRLRVETRRWLMEKRQPQRFGTKVDVNHGVQPDNPLASLLERVAGATIKSVKEGE